MFKKHKVSSLSINAIHSDFEYAATRLRAAPAYKKFLFRAESQWDIIQTPRVHCLKAFALVRWNPAHKNNNFIWTQRLICNGVYIAKEQIFIGVDARNTFDLEGQVQFIKQQCPDHRIIREVGSGINFKRRGFIKLLDAVRGGNVSEVVVAHKDRLCRFAANLVEWFFSRYNCKLVVLDKTEKHSTPQEEFASTEISEQARRFPVHRATSL